MVNGIPIFSKSNFARRELKVNPGCSGCSGPSSMCSARGISCRAASPTIRRSSRKIFRSIEPVFCLDTNAVVFALKRERREEFLEALKQFRFELPADYKFDRDEANERLLRAIWF